MEKSKVLKPNEINWEPHPQLANAKVAYLLSQRDEKADLTCLLVHLPAGTEVEKHTHDDSDDIVYVVKGKGKICLPDDKVMKEVWIKDGKLTNDPFDGKVKWKISSIMMTLW